MVALVGMSLGTSPAVIDVLDNAEVAPGSPPNSVASPPVGLGLWLVPYGPIYMNQWMKKQGIIHTRGTGTHREALPPRASWAPLLLGGVEGDPSPPTAAVLP